METMLNMNMTSRMLSGHPGMYKRHVDQFYPEKEGLLYQKEGYQKEGYQKEGLSYYSGVLQNSTIPISTYDNNKIFTSSEGNSLKKTVRSKIGEGAGITAENQILLGLSYQLQQLQQIPQIQPQSQHYPRVKKKNIWQNPRPQLFRSGQFRQQQPYQCNTNATRSQVNEEMGNTTNLWTNTLQEMYFRNKTNCNQTAIHEELFAIPNYHDKDTPTNENEKDTGNTNNTNSKSNKTQKSLSSFIDTEATTPSPSFPQLQTKRTHQNQQKSEKKLDPYFQYFRNFQFCQILNLQKQQALHRQLELQIERLQQLQLDISKQNQTKSCSNVDTPTTNEDETGIPFNTNITTPGDRNACNSNSNKQRLVVQTQIQTKQNKHRQPPLQPSLLSTQTLPPPPPPPPPPLQQQQNQSLPLTTVIIAKAAASAALVAASATVTLIGKAKAKIAAVIENAVVAASTAAKSAEAKAIIATAVVVAVTAAATAETAAAKATVVTIAAIATKAEEALAATSVATATAATIAAAVTSATVTAKAATTIATIKATAITAAYPLRRINPIIVDPVNNVPLITTTILAANDPIYDETFAPPCRSRIIQRKCSSENYNFDPAPLNFLLDDITSNGPTGFPLEMQDGYDENILRILRPEGYFEKVLEFFNCPCYVRNIHIMQLVQNSMRAVGHNISRNEISIRWEAEILKKAGVLRDVSKNKLERAQIWFSSTRLRDLTYTVIRSQGQMPYVEKAGHRENWSFLPLPGLIDCNDFITDCCENQYGTKGRKFSPRCPFRHRAISNEVCFQWENEQVCRKGKSCPYKHPGITVLQAQEKMNRGNKPVKPNKVKKSKSSSTCIFWLRNFCQKGVACPYAHAREKKPCPFTIDLKCHSDTDCPFKHTLNHVVRHRMWTHGEIIAFLDWGCTKFGSLLATFSNEEKSSKIGQCVINIMKSINEFIQQLKEPKIGTQSPSISKLYDLCQKSIDLVKFSALHVIRSTSPCYTSDRLEDIIARLKLCDKQRVWEALTEVVKYITPLQKHTTPLFQWSDSKAPSKPAIEPIITDLVITGDQLFWMLTSLELASRHAVSPTGGSSTKPCNKAQINMDQSQQKAEKKNSENVIQSIEQRFSPLRKRKKNPITFRNISGTSSRFYPMESNHQQQLEKKKSTESSISSYSNNQRFSRERKNSFPIQSTVFSSGRNDSINFRQNLSGSSSRLYSSCSSSGKVYLISHPP